MPITSITQFMDKLYEYISLSFKDYKGLAYKCNTSPDDGSYTSQPEIYKYLMPSSELVDDYPVKSPCIVLTVDSAEGDNNYTLSVHLCVKYDSVASNEVARKVAGSDNLYEFDIGTTYSTNSDLELYKSALLFTEFVHNKICMNKDLNITDITVTLPEPTLPEFPYATSAVTFKTQINAFKVAQNPYHDLY